MKRYLLVISLFFPACVFAQSSLDEKQQDLLRRGRLNLGVNVGGGFGGDRGNASQVTPRIQYFLADGWSVAAEGRYAKTGDYFSYVGVGLSTRYYVVRHQRFALFGQLGATYGQSKYTGLEPTNPFASLSGVKADVWQGNAGLGAHYRLARRWSVEATVERSQLQKAYLTPDYSQWQGNIGINYRLK